jgi:hypothetical protein
MLSGTRKPAASVERSKKVTSAIKFKTYTVRASKEEPQYLIKER